MGLRIGVERPLSVTLSANQKDLPAWARPGKPGRELPPEIRAEVKTLREIFAAGEWHRVWRRIHSPILAIKSPPVKWGGMLQLKQRGNARE